MSCTLRRRQSPTPITPEQQLLTQQKATSTFDFSPPLITPGLGSESSLLLSTSYWSSHTSLTHKRWLDSVFATLTWAFLLTRIRSVWDPVYAVNQTLPLPVSYQLRMSFSSYTRAQVLNPEHWASASGAFQNTSPIKHITYTYIQH